jgi:hypothetical protein
MLIATAGVAIYPFPRTKSSALAGPGQKAARAAEMLGLPGVFKHKAANTGNFARNQ